MRQQIAWLPAFKSRDLDETRCHIATLFKSHHLAIEQPRAQLDATVSRADMGSVSLVRLRHGADVFIDPGCLEDFYLLQIPVAGSASYVMDGALIETAQGQACMISPTLRVNMRFQKHCRHLILRLDRSLVERIAAAEVGESLRGPLEFVPLVDLRCPPAAGIASLIRHLDARAFEGDPLYTTENIRAEFVSLLVRSMVCGLPSNHSFVLQSETARISPRSIKRALSYINANLSGNLSPEAIAQAANTSVRSLHRAFKEFVGVSPMEYAREQRLLKIHQVLKSQQDAAPTIAEIANEFGFDHLGHFSAMYRRRFGELPSQTRKLIR